MLTEDQIKKLPKYAQMELNRLYQNEKFLRDQFAQISNGENNKIFHTNHKYKIGIPETNTIVFNFGEDYILEIRMQNDKIKINSYFSAIRVQPEATNVISVWSEKYK